MSKLPFWYLVGVIVVILISLFNYIGMRQAITKENFNMILRFQYLDYMLIGVWFTINIIIIFYLFNLKAEKKDFILPVYFVLIHSFYILVVVGTYYGIFLSNITSMTISILTTLVELSLVTLFLIPYFLGLGIDQKKVKTNINKRKRRPKKN